MTSTSYNPIYFIEDLRFLDSLCMQENMEWSSSITMSSPSTSDQAESVQDIVVESPIQSEVFITSSLTIKMKRKKKKN